jgi:hypothetical protein
LTRHWRDRKTACCSMCTHRSEGAPTAPYPPLPSR